MSDLARLAREAVAELGGHAPAWQIAEHVEAQLSTDDYRDITRAGFIAQVRNALRAKGSDGLPQAVSVDGEYVQTALLTLGQYRSVVNQYLKRGYANLDRAKRFDAKCLGAHGISAMPSKKKSA